MSLHRCVTAPGALSHSSGSEAIPEDGDPPQAQSWEPSDTELGKDSPPQDSSSCSSTRCTGQEQRVVPSPFTMQMWEQPPLSWEQGCCPRILKIRETGIDKKSPSILWPFSHFFITPYPVGRGLLKNLCKSCILLCIFLPLHTSIIITHIGNSPWSETTVRICTKTVLKAFCFLCEVAVVLCSK